MIAPLYEKRAPERVRTYNLPMVAALAVVALLGVLLATRIAPPTQWNTAQNGSPEPNVVQGVPDECAEGLPVTLKLYSRPSADAFITYEVNSVLYFPQSALRQLDAAEADGETWYFVSLDQGVSSVQGWMTAEEYNRNVRCAALVNADILTQGPDLTSTATPIDVGLLMSATAVVVQASEMPPTMVPPVPTSEGGCDVIITVADETALRQTPALDAEVVDYLPAGTVVQSIGQTMNQFEDETTTWVYVDVRLGDRRAAGWVDVDNTSSLNLDCLTPISQHPFYIVTDLPPDFILPSTGTLVPFSGEPTNVQGIAMFTATPVPFDGSMPTVVPLVDMQGLATFTATPVPFDGSMPTVVPTSTPFPLNGDAPPLMGVPEEVPFVPTVVPFAGEPTAIPPAGMQGLMESVPPYPVYTVKTGDTLFSILSQFNLSEFSVDELIFINNLTDISALPETLLIPVSTGMQLLTCVVDQGERVVLYQQPAEDSLEIMSLPEGIVFRLRDRTTEGDSIWYRAVAQFGSTTISGAWVHEEAISLNADCYRFAPAPALATIVPAENSVDVGLTATPIPTALPPSATPTPAR